MAGVRKDCICLFLIGSKFFLCCGIFFKYFAQISFFANPLGSRLRGSDGSGVQELRKWSVSATVVA